MLRLALVTTLPTIIIDVEGMTCQSCVKSIESVISEHVGVINIKVSLENDNALIEYDSLQVSPEQLIEAISDMGFDAFLPKDLNKKVTINVEGMTCQSCVRTITEIMSAKEGVKSIVVSLENANAVIEFDSKLTGIPVLCEQIEDMGFDAFHEYQENGEHHLL